MTAYQRRAARRAATAESRRVAACYRYWVIHRNTLPRAGAGK